MKSRLLCFKFILLYVLAPVSVAGNKNYIPMENIGLGTYYVNVNLAGMSGTQFMVDTGSGYATINEESLMELRENNNATYVRDIKGILANGSTYIVPIWRISSLTLNNQCTIKNIEVAVFPGNTRQILGLSALKKAAPLQMSFDPPQLILSNCDILL